MAPTTMKGSLPSTTASGRAVSGGSWERSCFAGEEADERAALLRLRGRGWCRGGRGKRASSASSSVRWVTGRGDVEFDRAVAELRERAQVLRQRDADHRSVCTSTESTAGRSRTIGAQESPAFGGCVDLAAGRAEVDAALVERVDGHGVAQDVDVAVLLREALGQRLPLVAAAAAAVDAQLRRRAGSARSRS